MSRTDGRVMREATTLLQAGMDVSIIDIERDTTRPREEDVSGVHLKHIRMPSWFVPVRFKPFFLVKALRMTLSGAWAMARTRADVYHAHDLNALPAAYLAARLHRKPLIFDAHELPISGPSELRWRRLSAMARVALRAMTPRCSGIITVSPPIADEIHRQFGGPMPVLVRNVLAYRAPMTSDRLREHLGLGPQVRIALYQGNLQADRALDNLVRAARYLEPPHVIVLMGNGALEQPLRELAQREGVSDRVRILPAVPYSELLAWTASADLGLIVYQRDHSPNVQMCLPNKLFEYLMAGVPVFASDLDAVADLVARYDVGSLVASTEPAVVGRALSAVLADREALGRMRRNALAAARGDLSWEHERSQLFGLYQRVLALPEAITVPSHESPEPAPLAKAPADIASTVREM
ncbi:MAG TPA: glycosyltransferase [Ktedonobacterales bacterium]